MDAVRYLECEPDEQRINVGTNYYSHYDANNAAFDEALTEEDVIEVGKAPLRGNDLKVVRVLRAMKNEPTLTEDQEEVLSRLVKAYENGDIPQNITKNIVKELKNMDDLGTAYFTITNLVPDQYLYERKDAVLHTVGEKQVILSCYLKEKTNE